MYIIIIITAFKEKVKQKFYGFLFGLPILKSIINKKFQQSLDK